MVKRSCKGKLSRDVNERAFAIGEMGTSEASPESQDEGKNPAGAGAASHVWSIEEIVGLLDLVETN
jgi:hypothetical protein